MLHYLCHKAIKQKGYKQQMEQTLKDFVSLTDEQKISVIKKLENKKEFPSDVLSGLKSLYEMSKEKTQDEMLNYLKNW